MQGRTRRRRAAIAWRAARRSPRAAPAARRDPPRRRCLSCFAADAEAEATLEVNACCRLTVCRGDGVAVDEAEAEVGGSHLCRVLGGAAAAVVAPQLPKIARAGRPVERSWLKRGTWVKWVQAPGRAEDAALRRSRLGVNSELQPPKSHCDTTDPAVLYIVSCQAHCALQAANID